MGLANIYDMQRDIYRKKKWAAAFPNSSPSTPSTPSAASPAGTTRMPFQSTTTTTPISGTKGPFKALQAPLLAAGQQAITGGQAMYQTGMDPQGELRAREEQRLRDAARVNAAARGITMSPYGAGVENQAMANFGIDWQNTQLSRQAQGMQGLAMGAGVGQGLFDAQYGGTTETSGYNTQMTPQQRTAAPSYAPSGGYAPSGSYGGSSYGGQVSAPRPRTVVDWSHIDGGESPEMPQQPSQSPYRPITMAPSYQDPTGGLLTSRGTDYRAITDPVNYPMASPQQLMGAYTGTSWDAPDVSTVGGTGGLSYQDLMGGPSQPSASQAYYGGADNFGGLGITPAEDTMSSWDDLYAEIDSW